MDKEHARFILRSFRPDGADAADPGFADALKLAMEDRELGEWLAHERASDAAFSASLQTLKLPDTLRREILDALAWQRGDLPHTESPEDEIWMRALASITPPPGMRDSIVAAMHACAVARRAPVPIWKKFGIPIAAAAAVALALAIPATVWNSGETTGEIAGQNPPASRLPIELVRAGFISTYQSPGFTLDTGRASHREIIRQLEEKGLPCPTCLPPGLRNIEGIGCREIIIDGHRGTLVCYERGEDGIVHLVIFRVEEIADPLPYRRNAVVAQHGDWSAAAWRNNENAFVLLGHTAPEILASLF
jgi:hypothetical protein